jgi:hypothetical protein
VDSHLRHRQSVAQELPVPLAKKNSERKPYAEFLKALRVHHIHPLLIIWPFVRAHSCKRMHGYMAAASGHMHLASVPPCSPDWYMVIVWVWCKRRTIVKFWQAKSQEFKCAAHAKRKRSQRRAWPRTGLRLGYGDMVICGKLSTQIFELFLISIGNEKCAD